MKSNQGFPDRQKKHGFWRTSVAGASIFFLGGEDASFLLHTKKQGTWKCPPTCKRRNIILQIINLFGVGVYFCLGFWLPVLSKAGIANLGSEVAWRSDLFELLKEEDLFLNGFGGLGMPRYRMCVIYFDAYIWVGKTWSPKWVWVKKDCLGWDLRPDLGPSNTKSPTNCPMHITFFSPNGFTHDRCNLKRCHAYGNC